MLVKIVKVSDKGQIAIPRDIRHTVGIKKGDQLVIIQENDKIMIEKSISVSETVKDDFKDLLKHSEKVAKDLWANEADEVWNNV